ncbi:hypothetical protein [Humibacter ginsenosidimutans]|uniref:Uncharacterized protein n=1 Tax=Humibacter ginsenosidimutans TaxID=2599293 RepID=A0A5B8M8N2_9MICO|nr:hypothetical protein [Humibacter ginsenosidimutans]QDZ15800.1 hypothetical protein FPZ11_14425 [Humibacter ginsenosidimutans]
MDAGRYVPVPGLHRTEGRRMRFQVEVPDDVFATLASAAESRGVRISDLLQRPLRVAVDVALRDADRKMPRRMTPAMQKRLPELLERGLAWPDVAKELGISVESARRWGMRLGVKSWRQETHALNAARRAEEGKTA